MISARRLRRVGIALAVLVGLLSFGTLSSSAATTDTTHAAWMFGGGKSLAIENLAGAVFRCDSAAGTWSVKASGIQVIASDHVTTWDTATGPAPSKYWIRVNINNADVTASFALTQDWTSGFSASGAGSLGANATLDCKAGVPVEVQGGSYLDNLNSLDLVGTQH